MMTDMTAPDKTPPMLNVFISYSRRNSDIANLLLEDLEARGFNAYFDKQDIVVGEDWRARLRELIAGSEVIVFLVSEASIQSEICQWEIDEAQRLGKRIFPAIIETNILDRVPGSLTHLNYSFLDNEDKWTDELDKLDAAIKLDATWLRAHRRLAELADRWASSGQDPGLLLRAEAIAEAEQMLARRPQNGPTSSDTILAFLDASLNKERDDRDSRRRLVQRSFIQPALTAFETDDPCGALRFLAAGAVLSDDPGLRLDAESDDPAKHALWRAAAKAACDPRLPLQILHGHEDGLWGVTLDARGDHILSFGTDSTARLWRSADGRLLHTYRHPAGSVKAAQFVPNANRVLTAGDDRILRLWDTDTGNLLHELIGHKHRVDDICIAPDGRHAISICGAPYSDEVEGHAYEALLWDLEAQTLKHAITKIPQEIEHIDFSADSSRFLIAGSGVYLYNTEAPHDVTALEMTLGKVVTYAKFNQNGDQVFVALRESAHSAPVEPRAPGFHTFNAATGALLDSLDDCTDVANGVAISPDESLIAIDGSEATTLWDLSTRQVRLRFPTGEHGRLLLKFSPDSQNLFIADTLSANLYDVETGQILARLSGHSGAIADICFSPDGAWFVTIAREIIYFGEVLKDPTIRKWSAQPYLVRTYETFAKDRIPTSAPYRPGQFGIASRYGSEIFISDYGEKMQSFTFSPPEGIPCEQTSISIDGRHLLYGDGRALAAMMTLDGAQIVSPIRLYDTVSASNFSRQADKIVLGTKNGQIETRDGPDWKPSAKHKAHDAPITAVAFDPDAQLAVSAADNGDVAVIEVSTGAVQSRFTSTLPRVDLIEASSGGRLIVLGSDQNMLVEIWAKTNSQEWKRVSEIRELVNILGPGLSIAISPNGQIIALGIRGLNEVLVIDASTGAQLMKITGHDKVMALNFHPNGDRLYVHDTSDAASVWDVSAVTTLSDDRAAFMMDKLGNGLGRLGPAERNDLLLLEAPQDLFEALLDLVTPPLLQRSSASEPEPTPSQPSPQHPESEAVSDKKPGLIQRLFGRG